MTRRLATFVLVVLAVAPTLAAARGPSTPAERRRAVETTRNLERNPLAPNADAERRWLLKWIIDIPDIQVQGCSGPLDALREDQSDERYGRLLYAQSMFGMAAFLIEHPREKSDWVAVQTAGIQSVLRAYRSLLRQDPDAHWEELDMLLAADRQGKLPDVVEQTMEGCGEPQAPGPGEAI